MKDHGSESSSEMSKSKGMKSLKSLLKKPGQSKPKSQKNRVVINEKLNEFFAADYIILIKEECCADYEEECDCCCQEHEMIRLGNCKECRAELNLQFATGGGRPADGDTGGGHEQVFNTNEGINPHQGGSLDEVEGGATTPRNKQQQNQPKQQQHETLSPPEGYKDLCDEGDLDETDQRQPICAECNYYHQQTEPEGQPPALEATESDAKGINQDANQIGDEDSQDTSDQGQQTTPDLHQRYLVETITMTTVTERRIVRELGGDEGSVTSGVEEADSGPKRVSGILKNNKLTNSPHSSSDSNVDGSVRFEEPTAKPDGEESASSGSGKVVPKGTVSGDTSEKETSDGSELSLTFKLGNVSLVSNSLKPNSAVRQLFPDPRFISPPPAANKSVLPIGTEEAQDEEDSEGQKFLITTESLRLFDAVKRSKLNGGQGEAENEPSTIRKTIERNALRRSLICKYEPNVKKKNLRSKEFTLEERIRQLTCLDLDDRDTESSASENTTTGDSSDYLDFPVRTSPSGEEAKSVTVAATSAITTATTMSNSQDILHQSNSLPQLGNQPQSTYKKITDIFAQKKMETPADPTGRNLPDLGIGNKLSQGKDQMFASKTPIAKMNSDARKQFLASLAPLSCVAGTGIENREDYYQLSSTKMSLGNSRDSVSYNSDSSYSLEDIEAALRGEERNYRNSGPPDVIRGTPTSVAGDEDSATDELLAFVEQDKTRTERIKKRYNDAEDQHDAEEDDDELNDYGFNRRPSVRGIKPKFGSTNEILRQLQSRSVAPGALIEPGKAGSHLSWPAYYNENDNDSKPRLFGDDEDETYQTITESRESNTINRINTMQRQIDDIYQTIAETAASVQGTLNRGSYLESTLPRPGVRSQTNGDCQRYSVGDQMNGVTDQHPIGARMLRIAGGGDPGQGSTLYNTLPGKARRHSAGYPCNVGPLPQPEAKCYRTMYLLPYNGMSDPTYQNIQRILPAHAAATNYANHVERYPYPRNTRKEQQQPTRYYARTLSNTTASLYSQSALHLHLHQPAAALQDEIRVPNTLPIHHGVYPVQQAQPHQHQHQHQQPPAYSVQPVSYPTNTPMRGAGPGGGYPYQLHLGRGAADVQTQTMNAVPACSTSSSTSSSPLCAVYNSAGMPVNIANTLLSSPTKMQQHRSAICNVAERGVPEGAASAPSHDFLQSNTNLQGHSPSPLIGHSNNGPPPNTQNSVYYAMNV